MAAHAQIKQDSKKQTVRWRSEFRILAGPVGRVRRCMSTDDLQYFIQSRPVARQSVSLHIEFLDGRCVFDPVGVQKQKGMTQQPTTPSPQTLSVRFFI